MWTMTSAVPPHFGWSDTAAPRDLAVELIVIERAIKAMTGPWHVAGALVRVDGDEPSWVEGWADDYWDADPVVLWEYFAEKGSGNAYSYEIAFLRLESAGDIVPVIEHLDAKLADGHPLGLPAQTGATAGDSHALESAADDEAGDPCADHVHVGAPFALADTATWQLAVELVRRHPDELWVIRTHPMDGHYDCLSVRRLGDVLGSPSVAINRNGTHVKIDRFDGEAGSAESPLMSWGDAFAAADPRDWIRNLERAAGLRPPTRGLPPSTRSSIALRWIGMFLRIHLGSRERWTAWNDWSEIDFDESPTDFDAIPAARHWLRAQNDPGAAAHVWFVGVDENGDKNISFALNSSGTLWSATGESVDLLDAYRSCRSSMWRLLAETAADLLP